MDEARFHRRAKPNDEIHISLAMTRLRAPLAVFSGEVKVQNQVLARVEGLTLAFGDFKPETFDATPDVAADLSAVNGTTANVTV
jgi:acyl-CoA thioesterase FadM